MNGFLEEWERPEFDSVPSLSDRMVYRLPGIDDALVRFTLQDTYREFCKRSAALRTWRKIELERGCAHYPVAPILSGEIDCVTRVFLDGRRPMPANSWMAVGDPPAVEINWRYVEFADSAHDRRFILVEAVEIPHIGEERAPRQFLRRYGDAVVAGSLARLQSQTHKPWGDPEQARQNAVIFENAANEARVRGWHGGPAANAGPSSALSMAGMV